MEITHLSGTVTGSMVLDVRCAPSWRRIVGASRQRRPSSAAACRHIFDPVPLTVRTREADRIPISSFIMSQLVFADTAFDACRDKLLQATVSYTPTNESPEATRRVTSTGRRTVLGC